MIDIGSHEDFSFTTNSLKFSSVKGSRIAAKFNIYPTWSNFWNFKILSVFLNQLEQFEKKNESPTRKSQSITDDYRYFRFYKKNNTDQLLLIYIHTDANFHIEVFVSHKLLTSDFFEEVKETDTKYNYFLKFTELSQTSKAILNSEPLAFFNLDDFSIPFIYFTKTITRSILNNRFTSFLFQFSKIFFKRLNATPITNLKQLECKTHGYLKIITANTNCRNLFKLNQNDNSFVIRGCYLSPFAKSIINDNFNLIDGLIFDGTFKILKHYVTCIIMAVSHNTSIPLGFTFSPFEDSYLYKNIFQTFLEIANIDLSNFVIESDQGDELLSVCKKYHCKHLCCQRHLSLNLLKKKYGFEAYKLISCRCQKDFQLLCNELNKLFIVKSDDLKQLFETTLNYVGLTFENDEISVKNTERWEEVSLMERIKYKMPTTTNSIESVHGHLNEATPRNNLFFSSIFRIIMSINTQIKQFNEKVHHNYRKIINDIKKKKK